ncbi:endo-1,4-beta-xylanase [Thermophagus xiamenensis]|uniref:Beta-xylanase n=1 Tax=Thermophagus xiamenensis TaxID=385682 RepID=A0A1I1UDY0_9BACT|nr:endo-1,4-beta-xylanase [Thermophagus xiamenensis]SFD68959.1 endo-1,4-beta-xylanase [Thermophagus xiamenensis]
MNAFFIIVELNLLDMLIGKKIGVLVILGMFWMSCQNSYHGLRKAADKKGLNFGFAVHTSFFNMSADDPYVKILKENANTLVAENIMKPVYIQPERGVFHFELADQLINFAEANDMKVRGHCLVWHQQIPYWMNDTTLSRQELLQIMKDHITTVVSRYKGRIKEWDVVNEAIDVEEEDNFRKSVWYRVIGPDYIDSAFVYAHRSDPDAILYYNDYDAEGMNEKSDAVYELASKLVKNNIPIHAIGLQSHFTVDQIDLDEIKQNIKRIGDLGLMANITELDIGIPSNDFGPQALEKQAHYYGALMQMILESENSNSFIVWGEHDGLSWIPGFTEGKKVAPLIFDSALNPKPAYYRLLEVLND